MTIITRYPTYKGIKNAITWKPSSKRISTLLSKLDLSNPCRCDYVLKLVTLMYIAWLWIVMFLGFINTKISNNHRLPSLRNFHASTIFSTSSFLGERYALPHFLENKQNSNPIPLCKVGEIQLWLITLLLQ